MKKKIYFICFCIMLTVISGCSKNLADETTAGDNTYDFLITNDTPLTFKSIGLTMDDDKNNVLLSKKIDVNDTAKFSVPENTAGVTVTLNPEGAYSIKKELKLEFDGDNILQYKIVIDKNEIVLEKQDREE